MNHLSYINKVSDLKKLCGPNFTNHVMLMLSGAEDLLNQEKYKDKRDYIDLIYDMAMPELARNMTKPSKALTTIAFNEAFRPEDYQNLIRICKTASVDELREFLTQEVDHEPKEKVIDYLSFPMLAMMTKHLKTWEMVDILLIEPNLIKKCSPDIRSKTLKELIAPNTYQLLLRKAPKELQEDLKIGDIPFGGWGKSVTPSDSRTVQAITHWADVMEARKRIPQIGTAFKIQQWIQKRAKA